MSQLLKVKTKTSQKGVDKMALIKKKISEAKGSYVAVGWQSNQTYPGTDTPVGFVATCQEYGTRTIPARPFMRPALDENKDNINKTREQAIQQACFGQWTCQQALAFIGDAVSGFIKAKILSNVPPPLADSTRRQKLAKGRDPVTLIDTGLMLKSLSYEVFLTQKLKERDEQKISEQKQALKKHEETQARRKELRAKLREEGKAKRLAQKSKRAAVRAQKTKKPPKG